MYRNKKILEAARGEECTLQTQYCNHNPETTVACHSPFAMHGKATRLRSHDIFICFGCSDCHDALDGRNFEATNWTHEFREILFGRANAKTLIRCIELGLL